MTSDHWRFSQLGQDRRGTNIYIDLDEEDSDEAMASARELINQALEMLHTDQCPPDPEGELPGIALFTDGPIAGKHTHLPAGVDPMPGDHIGVAENGQNRYLYVVVAAFAQTDVRRLLNSYPGPESIVELGKEAFTERFLQFSRVYYFLRAVENIETNEDLDTLVNFLRRASSDLDGTSDQMRYQPPTDPTEADKEMEEWDKILHPERYEED